MAEEDVGCRHHSYYQADAWRDGLFAGETFVGIAVLCMEIEDICISTYPCQTKSCSSVGAVPRSSLQLETRHRTEYRARVP